MPYDIKNHPANNSNVWENPNDPVDKTEHFKQTHIMIELLILKFKYNYYILHLTEQSNNDWSLTYLKQHGVYYRQLAAFVIHIETNPHTRIVL